MKEQLTLNEIRTALSAADSQRLDPELTDSQRQVFEQTAVTLRAAERSAIHDLQQDMIKDFEAQTKELSLQARQIRSTVRRLNAVAKAADKTETVVRECARVLRAIATYTMVLVLVLLSWNCGTVSKAQLESIRSLATMSDSLAKAPSAMFSSIDEVRSQRNLMYVASLQGVDARIDELNSIARYAHNSGNMADRCTVYAKVLASYMNALKSLALPERYSQYGTELRGLGRNVDSLLVAWNTLEWGDQVQNTDLGKQIGKTGGYMAEETARRLQRRLVKKVLVHGDTLVSTCCDAIITMLKTDQLQQLIDNEEQGLEANYRSYLQSMQLRGQQPDTGFDRIYLEQKLAIANVKDLRTRCTNALRSVKNAHHRLLENIDKCRSYEELSAELLELAAQVAAVGEYIE